jgi:hypothetical protein
MGTSDFDFREVLMAPRKSIATLFAFMLFFLPLSLFSQGAPPSPQIQAWLSELKSIQERLAPVEQEALQDPELQEEQEAIGEAVLAAMISADSTVEAKLDRLREIMLEAHGLNGDGARLDALAAEVQAIHPEVERVRAEALTRPEVETKLKAFRKRVQDRMAQIDPESRPLVTRFEELERLIRQSLPGPTVQRPVRGS